MTVVYYMQPAFLDATMELINVLKKQVKLHVLIELTPHGREIILEVDKIPANKVLATPEEVLTKKSYLILQPYLDGVASVHFVIHHHRTGLSLSTLQTSFAVWRYVKQFKPDLIHFETVGMRAIGMIPFLRRFKNVCITIHDPVPHSGEDSWKFTLPRMFFFNMPVKTKYLFYSHFSRRQFEEHYKKIKHPKMVLQMAPYSFIQKLVKPEPENKKYILFFGRLSPYKGIDNLLRAMPAVFDRFPNEKLVIAGKRYPGFIIDEDMINRYKNNITFIERYMPSDELGNLIQEAKFIVCPYTDATQSGVLMTAFGLKTPVIATNVGSFPEFIHDDINGLLVAPGDPDQLADRIIYALHNDHYKTLRQNIRNTSIEEQWNRNTKILMDAYS